uniref:SGNH hydrolase-type esterase domain-containing protein n=1 Tax=viral metagenome TaxID=1070528 RepID=A0A6C0HRN6_9ZZZZ
MIHIYGDSHASFSFKNLKLHYNDLHCSSVTMFRIGRDNTIINFNKNIIQKGDTIILSYGEVDCRCHIQRQINLGKNEDDIINELVNNYFKTIKNNINIDVKIIIVGVIPPTKQYDYEILHGIILDEFPFVGSDECRVRYTGKVNKLLEELSISNNYIYFNPYSYYERPDGTLKHELSDSTVHLGNNLFFLEKFIELYKQI